MTAPDEELMTVAEATQYLGIGNKKMSQLLKEGVLAWRADVLDKRIKLVKRRDVEALRASSKRVA